MIWSKHIHLCHMIITHQCTPLSLLSQFCMLHHPALCQRILHNNAPEFTPQINVNIVCLSANILTHIVCFHLSWQYLTWEHISWSSWGLCGLILHTDLILLQLILGQNFWMIKSSHSSKNLMNQLQMPAKILSTFCTGKCIILKFYSQNDIVEMFLDSVSYCETFLCWNIFLW